MAAVGSVGLLVGAAVVAVVWGAQSVWFWVILSASVVALSLAAAGFYTSANYRPGPRESPRTREGRSSDPSPVPQQLLRASYMYKLHESKRRKDLFPEHGCRQRVWAFNSKLDGYAFARSVGVDCPRTYCGLTTIEELDWDDLPERFVLKPHSGAASRGIMLLIRDGDGFRDLMDSAHKTRADIERAYRRLIDARLISPSIAVEELLAPGPDIAGVEDIPDDLKIYCFYDRPVVIMQRRLGGEADSRKWRFKFWTHDWRDLGRVKYADRCDPSLQPPAGADAVLDAAAQMGRKLAIPFVRLDLYDTDRGPVFGEVSPHPGPPELWTADADEMLGRAWEEAELRLSIEGISPVEPVPSDRTAVSRRPLTRSRGRRRIHEKASFAFKVQELARRRDALRAHGVDDADSSCPSVSSIAEWATELGVSTVSVHERASSIRELDWSSLPPRLSIDSGSDSAYSRRLLLARDGHGFRDLRSGQSMSKRKVIAAHETLVAESSGAQGARVEELPSPPNALHSELELADLFSVLCFGGRPTAVVQRRRWWIENEESYMLWTPEWDELVASRRRDPGDRTLEPPESGAALVGIAARVAGEVASTFVAVHVYDSERGLLLGQVTTHMELQGAWYPAIDELLGAAWEEAEARLMAADVLRARSVSGDATGSGR